MIIESLRQQCSYFRLMTKSCCVFHAFHSWVQNFFWKLQRIIKERRNHFLILMILTPTYLYWQQMQRQLNSFLCFRFRPTLSTFASIRLMIESIINIQLSWLYPFLLVFKILWNVNVFTTSWGWTGPSSAQAWILLHFNFGFSPLCLVELFCLI